MKHNNNTITDEVYEDLLVNYEYDISKFMLWLEHCNGIMPNTLTYHTMNLLISTVNDIKQFITLWDGDYDMTQETCEHYIALRRA